MTQVEKDPFVNAMQMISEIDLQMLDLIRSANHVGAEEGRVEQAQTLLKRGANLNVVHQGGWTPLIWSISMEKFEITHLFLDLGANSHITDKNQQSALHHACGHGRDDLVLRLAQKRIDLALSVDVVDNKGCTPLHLAASWKDNASTCALLMDLGADPNRLNSSRQSPFHLAATLGRAESCRAFLVRGADFSLKDQNGDDVLAAALRNADTTGSSFCAELRSWIDAKLAMKAVASVIDIDARERPLIGKK